MERNNQNYFAQVPQVNIERSQFDKSFNHKLTGNCSRLIPFMCEEVLPGDTFKVTTSMVIRLQTLLAPVMDDLVCDTYYFYTRNKVLWDHWSNFLGEAQESAWLDPTEYAIPLLNYPAGGFNDGTVADYMGIPTAVAPTDDRDKPIALPFRAYAMICNEFFRSEDLTDPLNIPFGDANQDGSNGDNYIDDVVNGGMPFKVAKTHDYFTSASPQPQKGDPVTIGLVSSGFSPVYAGPARNETAFIYDGETYNTSAQFRKRNETGSSSSTLFAIGQTGTGTAVNVTSNVGNDAALVPSNLWASNFGVLDAVSINDLRLAFQLQRFLERQTYGTRYREIIANFFGVQIPDQALMIPEYLGGHRFPIVIHQVANQAESDTAKLGDLGAMSNTSDVHEDFIKSFTEHGYVIGVMCVRVQNHTYGQGLNRMWSRRNRESFYFPTFAHLGAQPINKKEIYLSNNSTTNNDVFGYQEAWSEYRYSPSRISGEFKPWSENSLAHWTFADSYSTPPTLSDAWIREDASIVDRALAVTSSVSNQFFADIYVKNIVTRPMPLYSVPGLIDHF